MILLLIAYLFLLDLLLSITCIMTYLNYLYDIYENLQHSLSLSLQILQISLILEVCLFYLTNLKLVLFCIKVFAQIVLIWKCYNFLLYHFSTVLSYSLITFYLFHWSLILCVWLYFYQLQNFEVYFSQFIQYLTSSLFIYSLNIQYVKFVVFEYQFSFLKLFSYFVFDVPNVNSLH